MSWYSVIYIYVRNFRKRRPILGYFLHLSLNGLLIIQLIEAAFSYYVYTYVICLRMLTNTIQKCIYLSIYNSIFFMALWSLYQTVWTPVMRVPSQYKADKAFDKQIKKVTPFVDGHYMPNRSNDEQIEQQKALLEELVQEKGLKLVEMDLWERYLYCYQCSHLKPDRTRHCSSCGKCVVKFDHHCPLINNCINHGNYKFFLLYLFYACLIVIWSSLASIEVIARYFIKQNWMEEFSDILQVVICFAMQASVCFNSIGDLLIYHYELISINETSCEQIKPPVIRGDEGADYNLGLYHNFQSIFGWGLWLFPIDTKTDDGLHFSVRYTDECILDERLEVHEIDKSE